MNKLLIDESPLVFSPTLASTLNSCESAIILQQIHYWLVRKSGKVIDGVRWIYNRYSDWLEQFSWLTEWKLRKIMYKLRDAQILKFEQKEVKQYKRRGWYTIDYEKLDALYLLKCGHTTLRKEDNSHIEVCDPHTSDTENSGTKELLTTSTHPPHPVAVIKKKCLEYGNGEISQGVEVNQIPQTTELVEVELVKAEAKVELEAGEPVNLGGDNYSAPAEQKEKLNLIKTVGIRLNAQLEVLVRKFTLENVKNAIAYYQQTKRTKEATGKTINRPAGWLTDCLRQRWGEPISPEKTQVEEEFSKWYEKAIASGLVENLPISWLSKDCSGQFLVRQCKPGLFGAPYTIIAWRELQHEITEQNQIEENTLHDDFEEFD